MIIDRERGKIERDRKHLETKRRCLKTDSTKQVHGFLTRNRDEKYSISCRIRWWILFDKKSVIKYGKMYPSFIVKLYRRRRWGKMYRLKKEILEIIRYIYRIRFYLIFSSH